MITGALKIELMIFESRSLKDKRKVLQSVKSRLHDKFLVAVAEVDHNDSWQRCTLGIAAVSNEQRGMHSLFDKIVDALRNRPDLHVINYEREFYW